MIAGKLGMVFLAGLSWWVTTGADFVGEVPIDPSTGRAFVRNEYLRTQWFLFEDGGEKSEFQYLLFILEENNRLMREEVIEAWFITIMLLAAILAVFITHVLIIMKFQHGGQTYNELLIR